MSSFSEVFAPLLANLDGLVWEVEVATWAIRTSTGRTIERLGASGSRLAEPGGLLGLFADDEREFCLALLRDAAGGDERRFLHRFQAGDATRWMHTTAIAGTRPGTVVALSVDVTARHEAEKLLDRSASHERLLIEQLPIVLWTTDRELNFTRTEGAGLRAVGLSPDQLLGTPATKVVGAAHHGSLDEALRRTLEGVPQEFQAEVGARTFDVFAEPFRDAAGDIVGTLGVALDVTERRHAQFALAASESRMRSVLERLPAIVWSTDRDLRFTFSMGGGLRALRVAAGEVVGLPLSDYPPAQDPDILAAHRRALAGETGSYESTWDGRSYEARVEPLRDETGAVVGTVGLGIDVTESLETARALQQERDFSAALEQTVGALVLVLDREGRIVRFNRACERASGFTAADLLGCAPWEGLVAADDARAFRGAFDALRSTGAPRELDAAFVARDGTRRHLRWSSTALVGAHGAVSHVIFSGLDLTGLRAAEERVRDSEQRLRTLLDAMPDPVYLKDGAGRWVETNAPGLEVFGLSRDAVRGRTDREIAELSPSFRTALAQCEASDEAAWQSVGLSRGDELIRLPDGTARIVDVVKVPLFEADGSRRGLVIIGRDVTERHEAQKERDRLLAEERRARRRADFLAEASRALGLTLDYEQTLRKVAELAVPELADWCVVCTVEDEGGLLARAFSHRDPALAARAAELRAWRFEPEAAGLPAVARTGIAWSADAIGGDAARLLGATSGGEIGAGLRLSRVLAIPLVARDRTLGVLALAFADPDDGRDDTLTLAEDLARRAALAIDHARLYREAQEAISARDEFLSIASHELRTPGTSLLLAVQSLLRLHGRAETPETGELKSRLLRTAERQTRQLARLVDRLLDVSRLHAGRLELEPELADLAEVAREAVGALADDAARAGVTLAFDAPEPVEGRFDRARLEQVVTNLVSNAIKYGARRPVSIRIERAGTEARVVVRDGGIGIDAAHVRRIFGRFERAASAKHYGGLGLGLYIARQIVEAHGGSISCESSPGEGSTFTVALPLGGPGGARRSAAAGGAAA